jgi:3-oxoacyl-[acyl-carrier-protein] synthase-3
MKASGVGIIGTGSYVPSKVVTNDQIESWTGISAASIVEKTGIENRYIAEDGEVSSEMAASAARKAIEMAGISPADIGLIVVATIVGDYIYPALACKVQDLIGAVNAGTFDVTANCTGFQVALTVGSDRMIADPTITNVLVIGVALQSRFINWKDANASIYFGDGAGAVVLGRVPEGYGIIASDIFSNTKVYESVRLRGGGSSFPLTEKNINDGLQYYEVNGLEVWKQVIQNQPKVIKRVLAKAEKNIEDVDFFIFHQANLRLIEYLMAKMHLPLTKTYTNVAQIGNTAEASMVIALDEAVRKQLVKRDQLMVISGVGAGFIFGATILKWY